MDGPKISRTKEIKRPVEAMAPVKAKTLKGDGAPPLAAVNLALMDAAFDGNMAEIKAALTAGADPNMEEGTETAAMRSCRMGRPETLKALIDAGADLESRNEDGESAIIVAARYGQPECVRVLIKAGADVNAADAVEGNTALIWAGAKGCIESARALLAARANPIAKDQHGKTAEAWAIKNDHVETARCIGEVIDAVPTYHNDYNANEFLHDMMTAGREIKYENGNRPIVIVKNEEDREAVLRATGAICQSWEVENDEGKSVYMVAPVRMHGQYTQGPDAVVAGGMLFHRVTYGCPEHVETLGTGRWGIEYQLRAGLCEYTISRRNGEWHAWELRPQEYRELTLLEMPDGAAKDARDDDPPMNMLKCVAQLAKSKGVK